MTPAYSFTFCKVADRGLIAAKKIFGKDDGSREIFPYNHVRQWVFRPKEIASHNDLAGLLCRLAERPDVMLVPGAPRPGLDLSRPQLRRWADHVSERNTLVDVPRAWVAIDVDGYSVPAPFGRADQLANASRCIRDDALGEEFAGIACAVSATSSSGLAGDEVARLRLFFLLADVYPLADLHAWARGAQLSGLPLDPAVLQPGQPIYTSRPLFRGSLTDPVPVALRAFVLPGQPDRVRLDIHRYVKRATDIESRVERVSSLCGGDWRRLLEGMLGGPAGFYLPLTKALGLAARSADDEGEIIAFASALLAERADPARQRQYRPQWQAATLRRFRRSDHQVRDDIDRLRRRLFSDESAYG